VKTTKASLINLKMTTAEEGLRYEIEKRKAANTREVVPHCVLLAFAKFSGG